jgi:geranylgeranyl diphosphate synthase type II
MNRFQDLSAAFARRFDERHFPDQPSGLYDAATYILKLGGKRIRPVLCLMGNELFTEIHPDAWTVAKGIELFHNFTLIHDDIMDRAPLRRGKPTVHSVFNESSALLAGDVMLLKAYEYFISTAPGRVQQLIGLLNETGRLVCEGQQLDMDFESSFTVTLADYLYMIERKTAVLLAASLQMGAIIAGAGETDQQHLYAFGRNLGLAFQVQDDWLDAFGDPATFGKQTGGDIMQNKKTFLLMRALESANAMQKRDILQLLDEPGPGKVQKMLSLFRTCGADLAAETAQQQYLGDALTHLEAVQVPSERKEPLRELALGLLKRNA